MDRNRRPYRSILVVSALAFMPATAMATPNVATDSAIFVEKQVSGTRQLEQASTLERGDRVVTILRWYRLGGNGAFTISNPLPRAISYQKSSADAEEVSVDGGRHWGKLADLRIGSRMATPEDVTNVRWRISPQMSSLGKGEIAYSGIVR